MPGNVSPQILLALSAQLSSPAALARLLTPPERHDADEGVSLPDEVSGANCSTQKIVFHARALARLLTPPERHDADEGVSLPAEILGECQGNARSNCETVEPLCTFGAKVD